MKTVKFADELKVEKFETGINTYNYTELKTSGIYTKDDEVPLITTSGMHPDQTLMYSEFNVQFSGRVVNGIKMADILDSAKVPIRVKLGRSVFLAGKGFLAKLLSDGKIQLLFVATVRKDIVGSATIDDLKFYVSRDLQLPTNKNIWGVVKLITKNHKGDIVFTNQMGDYICKKLPVPQFKTIKDRKSHTAKIVDISIIEMKKERQERASQNRPRSTAEIIASVIGR